MKKLILLFAGIALLTVACKAEVNVLVDINEDRSGTIAFEFGLDDELRELLESQGGTADDLFGELDLDIGTEGGTVTERMINVGDLVQKNQAVYRLVDFDSLVAPVHIPEKQFVNLHVGQQALLLPPALSGRQVPARIKRISPVVDSQSGTVEVILEMERTAELRPGMFANARIVLDRHEDVIVLPKKTLVYEDEKPHVFVVEEGRARRQAVELGYQNTSRTEVTSGLDDGVLVVLVGQSTLKEGSPVAAEDENGAPVDGEGEGPETTAGKRPGSKQAPGGERAARGTRQ